MMLRGILTAGVAMAALFSSAAQADVVYRWQQVSASPEIFSSFGSIVLSDEAARSSVINYEYNGFNQRGAPDLNTPVISFSFGINEGGLFHAIGVSPRLGASLQGVSVTPLTALFDGLSGMISAFDANVDTSLVRLVAGPSGLWTITDWDNGNRACTDPEIGGSTPTPYSCSGATGRFVYVPEPGILPLMALGALGVGASLWRKRKA